MQAQGQMQPGDELIVRNQSDKARDDPVQGKTEGSRLSRIGPR